MDISMNDVSLIDKQIEFEEQMRSIGLSKMNETIRKAKDRNQESNLHYLRHITKYSLEKISTRIDHEVEKLDKYPGVKSRDTLTYITAQIPTDILSYVTLRTIFNYISRTPKVTSLATSIGNRVENELKVRKLEEEDKDLYRVLNKLLSGTSSPLHRMRVYRAACSRNKIPFQRWSPSTRVMVGMKLIYIAIESTGLFQVITQHQDKKTTNYLYPSQKLNDWIKRNKFIPHMHSYSLPCIIPPKPWEKFSEGGYYTDIFKSHLISSTSPSTIDFLNNNVLDACSNAIESVNYLQSVGWRVNKKVYEVLLSLWNSNSELGNLPPRENDELHPYDGDPKEDPDRFREWKAKAKFIHTNNIRNTSKRLSIQSILNDLEIFNAQKEFYYVQSCDFRGRSYYIGNVNPQGTDFTKALLEFSEGKALETEEARQWLLIHGANCYGKDDLPLEDRVKFIEENECEILLSTEDPYSNRFWLSADNPWSFLAFCYEYEGLKRNGLSHVSHLPVCMDASCSGLQHFSALSKSTDLGSKVNLTPSDKKQDIYSDLLDLITQQIEKDKVTNASAQFWSALKIDRDLAKKPVMTLAYGISKYGIQNQCYEWLTKKLKLKPNNLPSSLSEHVLYLCNVIWDNLQAIAAPAVEIMDFLKKVMHVACKANKEIVWITPGGFPVVHAYKKRKFKRINTSLGETVICFRIGQEIDELSIGKSKAAISPNFIHSLDSSHMMLTTLVAKRSGISSFVNIHDSFGTHAHDAAKLYEIVRNVFVELYKDENILENFLEVVKAQLPEEFHSELPNSLDLGSLDLTQVKDSQFFFS